MGESNSSKNAALQLGISDRNQDIVSTSSGASLEDSLEYEFKTPCTVTGIGAGVSSAMLGYVFGFGGYWISQRSSGVLKVSNQAGLGSARTFAILGGLYSGVSCLMSRLRQKNDALNAGVSGCSTGLVLGWTSGGPIAAVQSCAMFGLFSYFLDGTGGGSAQASSLDDIEKKKDRNSVLQPCLPLRLSMSDNNYFRH
jgi:import inner membrane translocase subunit TIM22